MEQAGVRQTTNSMGTAAMVIGIIALVLSLIPVIGFISWVLAPLAIIFGIIGLNNKNGAPKGGAIAGVATGGVALLICFLWLVAFGAAAGEAARQAEELNRQMSSNGF
jgi:hypothetical protein